MMKVPIEALLGSLKSGYIEYKECLENGSDEVDLAHIKGFCTTIEQILNSYGKVSYEEMMEIKKPIIGDILLTRKKKHTFICRDMDLDEPTILRRQKNNLE